MTIRADAHKPEFHRAAPPQLPVRCATTGNITISTGLNNGDTIDGITLATGDRVLVKDQSTGSQNGIYIVGASPARAFDFEEGVAAYGALIYVVVGTANAGTLWRCTNTTVPTIGSTALTFADYTPGAGGSALTVDGTPDGPVSPVDTINFTGSGDATVTVTDDGGGQVTVDVDVTSSGGGSDPTIPSGGTLYDGTSTSGWTTFGSPDTFDADSTIPGAFYLRKATMGTNNLVGVYRSTSSFPRTYTVKLLDGLYHADFHAGGIMFGEASAAGKMYEWGYVHDGGSFREHRRRPWTSITSGGSNVDHDSTMGATPGFPFWYRVVINSTTDVEFWQSKNGYIYYRYATAVNPSMTIAIFGFAVSTFSAIEMKLAVDWIHES